MEYGNGFIQRFLKMSSKKIFGRFYVEDLKKIIRICAVAFCIGLTITGIINFKNKGNGIGYHFTIVMPLISIVAGMGSKLIRKYWWIVLSIFHGICLIYVWLTTGDEIYGYIPLAIGYLVISGLVGYGFA